jgi:predicted regulator of Ras-like GTPase activity (Roadblock/LC7/MglB family)
MVRISAAGAVAPRAGRRAVRLPQPTGACASVASMDAAEALAELKELSTQIDVVALTTRSGELVASTASGDPARRLARLAADMATRAEQVQRDLGREALAQLQAATPDGCVFIVAEGDQLAVATTGPDPTVGLVFYDLKTLLRQLARMPAAEARAGAEEGGADA